MTRLRASRLLALCVGVSLSAPAHAAIDGICSVVDSAKRSHRGAIGFAGSPVVIPGFPGELSVPTGICDSDSTAPDFRLGGADLGADDLALSFVFTPTGPANVVVLSRDCAGLNTATCDALGMPVECLTAGPADIQFLEGEPFPGTGLPDPPARRVLRYLFPDTTPLVNVCLAGAQAGAFCRDAADCAGAACGQTCVGGTQHGEPCSSGCNLGRCGMPLTGPVAVASTLQTASSNDPIPCQLATASCAASAASGRMISCIDDVYRFDGTCRRNERDRDPDAFNMTAQPAPVALGDVCSLSSDPSRNKCINGDDVGAPCASDADCANGACGVCRVPDGVIPRIPVAQDKAGRLSSVASADGVLVVVDGESFPWLVQGATTFGGAPLEPVSSTPRDVNYSPLNPLFFGVPDPSRPGLHIASVDARYALQQSTRMACAEDPGRGCTTSSADCSCSSDSLAPLPNPLPGYASGAGPALLEVPLESAGGPPLVQLLGTVTIDTLFAARDAGGSDTAVAAPVSECLANTLPDGLSNADPDSEDVLMTLIDSRSGRRVPLANGLARATTRVVEREPFSLPTHDAEGSRLAFLEDEFHACDFGAGDCDLDGDGLPFGHVLRVFDVERPGVDLSPVDPDGHLFAARPDLHVNLSALAVSNGMVFFRAPAHATSRALTPVSAPGGGGTTEPSVSPDGAFVGFTGANPVPTSFTSESGFSVELVPGPGGEPATDDGAGNSVFTYRISGKGVDDGGQCEIVRAASKLMLALPIPGCSDPIEVLGAQPGGGLLANGDPSTGFGKGDPDSDVFLWDETASCSGTSLVSIRVAGAPRVAADAFALKVGGNAETGLIAGPGCSAASAVYVEGAAGVELASAVSRGSCAEPPVPSNRDSGAASVAQGGTRVAYQSDASDLVDGDQNGVSDVFVFDAASCTQTRVSVATGGGEANGPSFHPSISAAGDRVVFESYATNLAGGAPGLAVYLHDLTSGTTTRIAAGETPDVSAAGDVAYAAGGEVHVSTAGTLGAGLRPAISANGRWVSFETGGPDSDVLLVDLESPGSAAFRAGIARVPRECRERFGAADFEPQGALAAPQVSEDGRFLFYTSDAPNLVPDGSAVPTVYVEDRRSGAVAKLGAGLGGTAPDAPVADPSVSGDGSAVAFSTAATNLGAGPGMKVLVSDLELAGDSVLGVWDADAGFLTGFADPAEFVKVANGAALFIAPGSVKLFRLDCGAGGCTPLVEDLLRAPALLSGDALSISDTHACVVIDEAGAAVPACHEIGTPPSTSLDNIASAAGPECAQAASIQVVNETVVYTTPAGKLCQAQLGSGARPQPVLCGGAHCSASLAVLGPDEVVCFANPDSPGGDVMFVSDARNSDGAVSCQEPVVPCPLSVCDPRVGFTQEPSRTCKFLKPNPAAMPGPEPRPGDFLVVRCALGFDNQIVANANDLGAASNPFGLTGTGDGDVTRRPGCVDPATPLVFEGECPCTPSQAALGFVCSDSIGIVGTDNAADQDGDGVNDADEICDLVFNPDGEDLDADGIPDACDGCVIDGVLSELEGCDPLDASDPLAAFCGDQCEIDLPTSFTTASGYTVELQRGPNGELASADGMGNSTYSYQIRGKGVDDDSKCFKVRAASKLFEALPIPTCTGAPLQIVSSVPAGNLLANGDKSTGFGRNDPGTDVFAWGETVSCDGTGNVSLTAQGPPSFAVNAFALKVGKNAEGGLIVGPGCPAP